MASLRSGREGRQHLRPGPLSARRQTDLHLLRGHGVGGEVPKLARKFGPAKALEAIRTDPESSIVTVEEWLDHHIAHLTGLRKSTLYDYRAYAKNDIVPILGELPLTALSRDDIARWMQAMTNEGASGKTIANKHGFLSSALNAAVRSGRISANPAAGQRLPVSERADMICLTMMSSPKLLAAVTEPWRPLVEFLVASGCRWGEATALRPSDVDREAGPSGSHGPGSGPTTGAATNSDHPKPRSRYAQSTCPSPSWTSSTTPATGSS